MRWLSILAALFLSAGAQAQVGCVPNPNDIGPKYSDGCRLTGTGLNHGLATKTTIVSDNGTLRGMPAIAVTPGISTTIVRQLPGAPPLNFVSNPTPCPSPPGDDGGSCLAASDGGSWRAQFNTGRIDIRQFGALADNATPADTAVAATIAYAGSIGACTYVPPAYPGFTFQSKITLFTSGGTDCLVGDRWKSWPSATATGQFGQFVDLHFPNNTDGIYLAGNKGGYIGGLSLQGNALNSTVSTHTHGIQTNEFQFKIESVFLQNFVVCQDFLSPSNRFVVRDVFCDEQQGYPNIVNDYPFAGDIFEIGPGGGTVAAAQLTGEHIRAAAGGVDATYTADGTTTWFQICPPGAFNGGSQPIGVQLNCGTGPFQYNVPLWRADGIKVRAGPATPTLANGQGVLNGPLLNCGNDYTIWDVSASGGGGSGGTQLICGVMTGSLQNTFQTVNTTGLVGISNGFVCPNPCNVIATADHGIQPATKVLSVSSNALVLSPAVTFTDPAVTVTISQIAIATGGPPSYSQACQATATCGRKIEVRFSSPPAASTLVDLQWSDPTGYVAYYAPDIGDYVQINPVHVGGYAVGLKHTGIQNGGLKFEPAYIELLNRCVQIEAQGSTLPTAPFGDKIILHRIVNDPVPDCPGYVDSNVGPTVIEWNNTSFYRNFAENGGLTRLQTTFVAAGQSDFEVPLFATLTGRAHALGSPFSFFLVECNGLRTTAPSNLYLGFGLGQPITWINTNYHYAGTTQSSAATTPVGYGSTSDIGISLTGGGANWGTAQYLSLQEMRVARLDTAGIAHQASAIADLDTGGPGGSGGAHVRYTVGGAYFGSPSDSALTGFRIYPSGTTFAGGGVCSVMGHY